jgi:hypothetical protein
MEQRVTRPKSFGYVLRDVASTQFNRGSLRGKCSSESKKESQIYQSSCGEKGKRKPELDQVVREPEPHTINY